MNAFEWMAWTLPTALFFIAVVLMLIAMTVWQLKSPTIERRGLLPIVTTRGDRLFIGLLSAAYIHLAWLGFGADGPLWWASLISLAWLAFLLRWG